MNQNLWVVQEKLFFTHRMLIWINQIVLSGTEIFAFFAFFFVPLYRVSTKEID